MNATKKGRAKARTTGASPATSERECCTEGGNDTNFSKCIAKTHIQIGTLLF